MERLATILEKATKAAATRGASIGASTTPATNSADERPTCPYCGGTGVVERFGSSFTCRCYNDNRRAVNRKYSGLPRFEKRPLTELARRYLTNYERIRSTCRNWIAFLGRSGSGKSTQAFMIADALLDARRPIRVKSVYYPEIVRILASMRFDSFTYQTALDNLLAPELVILDDFLDIIPKPESFEEQIATEIIKRRYVERKPLIITSELTPSDFQRRFPRHGEAILGRIIEMCDGRVSVASESSVNYRFSSIGKPNQEPKNAASYSEIALASDR